MNGRDFAAIIVAAGQGVRAGMAHPKQWADLAGRRVVDWSVAAFMSHTRCAQVIVAVPPDDVAGASYHFPDAVRTVAGGATRAQSVRNALALVAGDVPLLMVHDAARPGVDDGVIDALLATLEADAEVAGAVPVWPCSDTMAQSGGLSASVGAATLGDTVDRAQLVRVQTPQLFRRGWISRVHGDGASSAATDDAQLVRAAGGVIRSVVGGARLDKITLPGDLAAMASRMGAATMASNAFPRITVGNGFDVHRLAPGDGIWLGGMLIPCGWRLVGHSDADVLLHAITDAVLGGICAGDIGDHFPPSDPQWRGAASHQFLRHAVRLAANSGAQLQHVDATVMCEYPKLSPHRLAIREVIADIMGLALHQVSVKATTTERLGFTGRGEGIAAQASVTLAFAPDNAH